MATTQSKQQFNDAVDPLGGPAFPIAVPSETDKTTGAVLANDIWPGMTLRDWFAGQALTGLIPAYQAAYGSPTAAGMEVVGEAYGYADIMIAARKGGA